MAKQIFHFKRFAENCQKIIYKFFLLKF